MQHIILNNQFRRVSVRIITMDQNITDNLTGNTHSGINTDITFKDMPVIHVLKAEIHKPVIRLDQIDINDITIIISINILLTKDCIRLISGHTGFNHLRLAKQKDSRKSKATLSGYDILNVKTCRAHNFHIIHTLPGVLFIILFPCQFTHLIHKFHLQMGFVCVWQNHLLMIICRLPGYNFRNTIIFISYILIRIVISVIDPFLAITEL